MTSRRTKLASSSAPIQRPQRVGPGRWLLGLRLRLLDHSIARLERELAGQFATTETEPLVQEHAALVKRREALRARLG